MDKQILGAVLGIIGVLISAGVAAWVTVKTKRLDHIVEDMKLWVGAYETKLLDERLREYRKLWALTESTSRRRVHALTPDAANALAEQLTGSYYREGGIVLSEEARQEFFDARTSLDDATFAGDTPKWHSRVVDAFSSLRTALCDDINSRRGPRLRSPDRPET